jgi:hypothetical protein
MFEPAVQPRLQEEAPHGRHLRRQVHLGHWAPGRLRAADAGIRDRTMTVAMARSAAIQKLGVMRARRGSRQRLGGGR